MKFQQIFYIALCVLLGLTCVLAEAEPEPEPINWFVAAKNLVTGIFKTGGKAIVKTGGKVLTTGGKAVKTAAVKGGKLAIKTGKEALTDAAVDAIQQLPKQIGDAINGNQQLEE